MKGYISVKGSKGEGYTVRIYLPETWLRQFGGSQAVWGNLLGPEWGKPVMNLPREIPNNPETLWRVKKGVYIDLRVAMEDRDVAIAEIKAANEALRLDVVDELTEIDLS